MIPGIQLWITILRQMPSHVSHAENFLEAANCLCVTDWKNATSFRIYVWVLSVKMMQSLQSTSTQSSRGLSKVSAYWVANLYRTKPAVLLNITTLWERDIPKYCKLSFGFKDGDLDHLHLHLSALALLAQFWHTSLHPLDMSIFLKCANVHLIQAQQNVASYVIK